GDDPSGQSRNSGSTARIKTATPPRPNCTGDRWCRRRAEEMVQKAARAMKTFGKRERDGTARGLTALTRKRDEPSAGQPVMPASLRERVIEQIDPSVAATVSRDVLGRQIEEIIHGIANAERLELSGREQFQLADEIADDMTGYGPLRPLLLDESINDIMVNGPSNVYVERKGKLERVAMRFPQKGSIGGGAEEDGGRGGTAIGRTQSDGGLPPPSRQRVQRHLPAASDP